MAQDHVAMAEAYYIALGKKDVAAVEKFLHPDVQFVAPLAKVKGKAAVLEASKKFTSMFSSLKIRAKFGSGNQTVVIYETTCPEPIGSFSAASFMTFKDNLIANIELLFDARPFQVEPKL